MPSPSSSDFGFDFRDVVEAAKDAIIVTKAHPIDLPGPEIVYVNRAFTELTGYTFEETVGKTPRILQYHGTNRQTLHTIRSALLAQKPLRTTLQNCTKAGKPYWLDISLLPLRNADGNVTHFIAIERDITEQKVLQMQLEQLSSTDPLTKLLNRRTFSTLLDRESLRRNKHNTTFSILMLDIDHFKVVNDTYGHPVGDSVLEQVSEILRAAVRVQDSVARMGGEEFCILLPDASSHLAYSIAERIRDTIARTPMQASQQRTFHITISIGVAEALPGDTHYKTILVRADRSLYQAKADGRNRVCHLDVQSIPDTAVPEQIIPILEPITPTIEQTTPDFAHITRA